LGNNLPSTIWRRKHEIIRYYDKLVNAYNSLYRDEQDLKIEHSLRHVNLNDSDLVLDAGCGTGFIFEYIYDCVGHLVGVDLSIRLLKVALAYIKKTGMKTVSLVCADVDYLPFRDRVFDMVFALTLLQDSPDLNLTLKEMMRATKDESTFVVSGLKKVFDEASFKQVLIQVGLEPNVLLMSEQVKDIIAVCWKRPEAKDK
jgi:ubiquinone/menaquinone biosynthesis C-methylase UbiE